MRFSVIIPVLNSECTLHRTLESVAGQLPEAEIIIADGGSTDATHRIAREYKAKVVRSKRGRGTQLNAGAAAASGKVFIFLHSDTVLPVDSAQHLEQFVNHPELDFAKFRMKFDYRHSLLDLYGYMTRFDSLLTSFGDQCIVVKKGYFSKLGCFPEWPLFEDVRLFQKARSKKPVFIFESEVITSAEKFIRNGIIRQQWQNLKLIISYTLGVNPETLYQKYSR